MNEKENLKNILNDAMEKEKIAEKNCKDILNELIVNGEKEAVKKIKDDEITHQKIVQQLLDMI